MRAATILAGLVTFFFLLSAQVYWVGSDPWRPKERSRYPVALSLMGAIWVGAMVRRRRPDLRIRTRVTPAEAMSARAA